ncbi:2-oxoacid ferredoxin oxidoreductase [Candidatus Heimdallarchaeota archaeon B3_Heim]|nr:MAG: 2-oxoacid ferredoxin oxidoreductase [Candidatus Heimdallarchaeota archaeon B3_Heim]
MDTSIYDMPHETDVAWCPGCGNFSILKIVKQALTELDIKPEKLVMASGIGQAAKTPHYLKTNVFNGLHGRAVAAAMAVKAANPELTVIVESGDGCSFGEGGNHFIHNILRNPNITHLAHDNMVYGLTKGQASPTSQFGFITPVQVQGVTNEPFNPLALAIALDAAFVARVSIADQEKSFEVIKQAISFKGYSFVDILQPCVSFNKINTWKWFRENVYYLEESYDPKNRTEAFKRATEKGKLPLGVFYKNEKPTFEDYLPVYKTNKDPLFKREANLPQLQKLIDSMRQ